MQARCPGCGIAVDETATDGHRYVGAAPGCWELFGRVLAREYEALPALRRTHLLTVDTYCVQHPGVPGRQSIQSVNLHLARLYLSLERGVDAERLMTVMRRLLRSGPQLAWLDPPAPNGTLSVRDVLAAGDLEAHQHAVDAWARDVWQAWAAHHGHAARLAAGLG